MSQALIDALPALHFASQLPAAFAACRVDPRDDCSHNAHTLWTGRPPTARASACRSST